MKNKPKRSQKFFNLHPFSNGIRGVWRIDSKNNLVFSARRISDSAYTQHPTPNTLIKWSVTKKGYLQYKFGPGERRSLTLYGRWLHISDTRLIYKLKGSKDKLEFKVTLQPRQHLKHNRLAYNITAGRKKSRRVKTLYFAGKWLINKKGDKVRFRLSLPNTRKKTITFGVDKVLKEGKALSAVLSTSGTRRRIRLTLRKKDWSVFMEGAKSTRSKSIRGGVRIKF